MPDKNPSRLQGLLLAQSLDVWAAQSTYTEQSPIPGLAAPVQDTRLRLIAGGVPVQTTAKEVRVQHAGLPGQIDHGCTIAARRDGEAKWTGWEPQGAWTGWEAINYNSVGDYDQPSICTLPNGTVIVVAAYPHPAGIPALHAWTRAAGTGTWSGPITIWVQASPYVDNVYFPCLLVVEDEVYVVAWRRERRSIGVTAATDKFFLSVWRSTDSGSSWANVQNYASIDEDMIYAASPAWTGNGSLYYIGRLSGAYRDGEVIVLSEARQQWSVGTPGDVEHIRQYAGASLMARLDTVGTFHGGSQKGWARPDVVATSDGFTVVHLTQGSPTRSRALSSAWQPLSTAVGVDIAPNYLTSGGWSAPAANVYVLTGTGECAVTYDPAGVLWVVTTSGDTIGHMLGLTAIFYSPDGGTTWTPGNSSLEAFESLTGWLWIPRGAAQDDPDCWPVEYRLTWQRGRAILVHRWFADTSTHDGSIAVGYLGGWSDLEIPQQARGVRLGHRAGFLTTWLPYERPDDQTAWSTTTAGVSSSVLSNNLGGTNQIITGDGAGNPGQHRFASNYIYAATQQAAIVEWDAALITGGSITSLEVGVLIRLAGAAHGIEVEFRMTPTTMRIYDAHLPGELVSVTGLTAGVLYTWRVGMYLNSDTGTGRNLQVWYRATNTSEHRQWTRVGSYTLVDDAGAGWAWPRIRWGHCESGGGATINSSHWRRVQYNIDRAAAPDAVYSGTFGEWWGLNESGGDNPVKMAGRPLGTAAVWLRDGVTLAGRRGPGWIGEEWSIPVTGEYDVSRAISRTVPTPAVGYRSIDDSASVTIAWAADHARAGLEDMEHPPLMALHIAGANWRLATLQSKTAAGGWVTQATIDTRVLAGVTFARTGKRLRASAPGSTVYLTRDECYGGLWTAEWDSGGGVTRKRHVAGNDEGRWTTGTSEPLARLELASTLAGDPTSGGTLSLYSPQITVIVPGISVTGWRLVIDSTHDTADDDYRVGSLFWGPFHVFAREPSWGRGITHEPGHEAAELEGYSLVDVTRSADWRELRIAWDDGIDESQIYSASEVGWVDGNTGGAPEPVAAWAATSRSLIDALRRHQGKPVVWATFARDSSTTHVLLRRRDQFLGVAESAPNVEIDKGDEAASEVHRMATLTLREIL